MAEFTAQSVKDLLSEDEEFTAESVRSLLLSPGTTVPTAEQEALEEGFTDPSFFIPGIVAGALLGPAAGAIGKVGAVGKAVPTIAKGLKAIGGKQVGGLVGGLRETASEFTTGVSDVGAGLFKAGRKLGPAAAREAQRLASGISERVGRKGGAKVIQEEIPGTAQRIIEPTVPVQRRMLEGVEALPPVKTKLPTAGEAREIVDLARGIGPVEALPSPKFERVMKGLRKVSKSARETTLTPEFIVRNDPAAKRIVQGTFDAFDLRRTLQISWDDSLETIAKGLTERERKVIGKMVDMPMTKDLLAQFSPKLQKTYMSLRHHFDTLADRAKLPFESRLTNYFPHLTDNFEVVESKLVKVPTKTGFVPADILSEHGPVSTRFFKKRTPGTKAAELDFVKVGKVYNSAVARVVGLNEKQLPVINSVLEEVGESWQDYIKRYIDYTRGTPAGKRRYGEGLDKAASLITRWQFQVKIGGNLTTPLINLSQNLLTYADVGERGMLTAAKILANLTTRKEMIALARKSGALTFVSKGQIDGSVYRGVKGWTDILAFPFQATEQANRLIAFTAGVQRALGKGASIDEAVKAGKLLNDTMNFRYGRENLPELFRSPWGRILGQFKKFPLEFGQLIYKKRTDVAFQARLWSSMFLLGGTGALPIIGEILDSDKMRAFWKEPDVLKNGIPFALGLQMGKQIGRGSFPGVDFAEQFFLGPGFEAAREMFKLGQEAYQAASGDETVRSKERIQAAILKSFVPAGVQLNRVAKHLPALLAGGTRTNAQGEVIDKMDLWENIVNMIGLPSSTFNERRRMIGNIAKGQRISRTAKRKANNLKELGRGAEAEEVLNNARKKIDTLLASVGATVGVGELTLTEEGLTGARRRQTKSPLESMLETAPKSFRPAIRSILENQ